MGKHLARVPCRKRQLSCLLGLPQLKEQKRLRWEFDVDYRSLGRSGLKVSQICLGAMMFGDQADEATSVRIIAKAADAGVNMIDTANVYARGFSEQFVGKGIRGNRDNWVIATKTRNPAEPGPNNIGLSRKQIMHSVEGSLRRLNTDYIDILTMHMDDFTVRLSEAMHAMSDLVRQGKIRYFGVSNFRSWRIAEICRICDQLGIDRPAVSSPLYNITNRKVEVEELPACNYFGIGVVSYSPLARSVLTGDYNPGMPPDPSTRAGRNDMRLMMNEWRPETLELAQKVKKWAGAKGITAIEFAVAWVLNNRLVTGAVAGPCNEAQLDGYLKALDYRFSADDEAFVDSLVARGSQSTHGHTDPYYPIEGRDPYTEPARPLSFINDTQALLRAKRTGTPTAQPS
jgi:aryl-alcohol dehydrogenase (NADP+)